MSQTIKRGDAATITLGLGVDLDVYTTARVIIARIGGGVVVDRNGTIDGQAVTIELTPTETERVGSYRVEVEMSPGPHTYPTTGYGRLEIVPDLG